MHWSPIKVLWLFEPAVQGRDERFPGSSSGPAKGPSFGRLITTEAGVGGKFSSLMVQSLPESKAQPSKIF